MHERIDFVGSPVAMLLHISVLYLALSEQTSAGAEGILSFELSFFKQRCTSELKKSSVPERHSQTTPAQFIVGPATDFGQAAQASADNNIESRMRRRKVI